MAPRPPIQAVIEAQAELDTDRRNWRMVLFNEDGTPFTGGGASAGISGIVNADGTIARGTGFTVVKTAVGMYAVTFDPVLAVAPIVGFGQLSSLGAYMCKLVNDSLPTVNGFEVVTFNTTDGQQRDGSFWFIAA